MNRPLRLGHGYSFKGERVYNASIFLYFLLFSASAGPSAAFREPTKTIQVFVGSLELSDRIFVVAKCFLLMFRAE